MNIKYSVVIPTYNRAELLKQCLESLAHQTVSRNEYEIIVINDGSRDHTDKIIQDFTRIYSDINFTYIKQENHGVSHARNRGIRRAKGDIIFFTDDDCVVPPNWIKTLADGYHRHPDVAGVGGWYEYSAEILQKNSYASYTTYEFKTRFPENQEIKTNNFINPAGNTSNMSYRKSILGKVHGFDEEMRLPGFDDWEIKKRIMDTGSPLLYIPIFVLHNRPLTMSDITVRIFYFGMGRYQFIRRHPELSPLFYPSWGKLFGYTIPQIPLARIDLCSMAFIQFILTKLGWEYQKCLERHKRSVDIHE